MTSEQNQLEAAISALEAQRGVLGDEVVDASLSALRAQLAAFTSQKSTEPVQTLKQVTILFLDVVGSTALSQQLDPEAISEVMDNALRRGAEVVTKHGGKVLKYTGDNILAVFGADEAREDDPERAVQCGLALLELSKVLGAEVRAAHGLAGFNVRVGIHTGRVLLGGGVDGDANIRGSSVNIAARMEQTAPAGCIRISHDTYVQVRGHFEVQAQAPLAVKGVDAPVRSYLVSAAKPRRFRIGTRGVEGVSTRMVGRDAELEALQNAFRRLFIETAREQKLAVVTVVGDAGIGKSRLLYEFEAWRDRQPESFQAFRGRATPQTQDRPFALLGDILARRFQIADDDSVDVARQKLEDGIVPLFLGDDGPELSRSHAHLLGHLMGIEWKSSAHPANFLDDAKQTRNRAFYTAAQLFRRVSAQDGYPVVLQLDDLHWADPDSLAFLSHLIDVNRDVALLILGFTRPPLFERRSDWMRSDGVHQLIELAPLANASSNALVDGLLKNLVQVPTELRELIIRRAEGNPFFMEELVSMLIDQGAIETDGPWKVNAERLLATNVPPTLTGVLQTRLDGLSAAEKLTLQEASVIGPVFWEQALEAIDGRATETLPSLVARGLVLPGVQPALDGLREYTFRHQLLHQVTYDTVLKGLKRELHAKAARWLSLQSGLRTGEFSGLTAEHYERAGDAGNAAEFHARAAEHAAQRLAHETVLMHVSKALSLLGEADAPQLRWRLVKAREGTLSVQARRDEQAADLDEMDRLAERLGDDEQCAHVAFRRSGRAYEMGDWEEQERAALRCMTYAARAGAHWLRLSALRLRAGAQVQRGEVDAGARLLRDGLVEARRLGFRYIETLLLNTLSVAADARSDAVELLELQQQCLRISQEIGDRQAEALAMINLGVAWSSLGDWPQARSYLERGLVMSRACGSRLLEGQALGNLSMVAHYEGEHATAVSLAKSAHELFVTIGARSWQAFALLNLGEAELALGNHESVRQAFQQALNDTLKTDDPMQHDAAAGLARAALAQGDAVAALRAVRPVLDHVAGGGKLEGTEDSRMIEWTLYRVLAAADDPRAAEWLARADDALRAQAAQLADDGSKHGFLNNIPHHREIVAAWASRPQRVVRGANPA